MLACKESPPEKAKTVFLKHEIRHSNLDNSSTAPTLILIHGYGSNEKDLFSFSNVIDSSFNIITPRAPITLYEGQYTWYNLELEESTSKYKFENVQKAKHDILSFINEVKAKYNLDHDNLYIGGFSQGAILSLYLGLTEPEMFKGVVSLSGHLYSEVKDEIDFSQPNSFPNIFVSHGRKDVVLAFSKAEKDIQFLENNGLNIDEHWYNTSHSISRDNLNDMLDWLHESLK